MAKKVRCPQCGAKNAADARRCRVCTTIINADVPAAQHGQGIGQGALGVEAPSAAEPAAPPDAPVAPEPMPVTVEAPDAPDGIVIDALPRNPEAPPPPLELDDDEPFDPDGLIIDPPR